MSDAAPAKPAFFRILKYRGFAFLRIALKGIAHAHFDTCPAPVTDLFIEINMAKRHWFLLKKT